MARTTLKNVLLTPIRDPVFLRDPVVPRIYPELALCSTPEEDTHARKLIGAHSSVLSLPVFVAIGAYLAFDLSRVYQRILGTGPVFSLDWLAERLLGFLFACAVGYAVMYLIRERGRRRLRDYLLSRGHALCVECGYDVRGVPVRSNDRTVCPECGHDLDDRAKTLLRGSHPPRPAVAA